MRLLFWNLWTHWNELREWHYWGGWSSVLHAQSHIFRVCLAFVSSYLVKLWQFRLISQFGFTYWRAKNETQNELSNSIFSILAIFSITYLFTYLIVFPILSYFLNWKFLFYTKTLTGWQIWNLETLLTKKTHALKFDPNLGRNLGQITRHVFVLK